MGITKNMYYNTVTVSNERMRRVRRNTVINYTPTQLKLFQLHMQSSRNTATN